MPTLKLLLFVLIAGVVMLAARGWFGARFTTRSNLWVGSALVVAIVCILLLFTSLKWLAGLLVVLALPLAIIGALLREGEGRGRKGKEGELKGNPRSP